MAEETGTRSALVAVSTNGTTIALRLGREMGDADVFLPEWLPLDGSVSVQRWSGHLGDIIPGLFGRYAALVFFGSVGMAVRLIAGSVKSKQLDPAVVVVDDAANFAVSILSGHEGGANALAKRIGMLLGATPVITTASDVLGTIGVDLLGREFRWQIERRDDVTRVSAAIVSGETVGLVQDTGERDWWTKDKPFPANVMRCNDWEALIATGCEAGLIITDRMLTAEEDRLPATVIYRPRSLVVGIGCNRGTSAQEIQAAVETVFADAGLALASIRNLATIDLKKNETGMSEYARDGDLPIVYFSRAQLERVVGMPNPSTKVRECVGTAGVCEPAALLSSGARGLLVAKRKTKNVTLAVARIEFSTTTGG